jgi:hypothetical protein
MRLVTPGNLMNFAAVPFGRAIRFERDGHVVTAIKTAINGIDTAAIVHGVAAGDLFTSLAAVYFQHYSEVFAMPELDFVLSPDPDDIIIGRGTNFDRGHLFLYENAGAFFSMKTRERSSRIAYTPALGC